MNKLKIIFLLYSVLFTVNTFGQTENPHAGVTYVMTGNTLNIIPEDGISGIMPDYFLNSAPWSDAKTSTSHIYISPLVLNIGDYAFYSFNNVTTVDLPDNLTGIGQYAFNNCTKLESIEIPDGIERILPYTFLLCTSLKEVQLPAALQTIELQAFASCRNLKHIEIPPLVGYIQNQAFNQCTGLAKITVLAVIPPTVQDGAFDATIAQNTTLVVPNGLESVYADAPFWEDFENIVKLFETSDGVLLQYNGSAKNVVIPAKAGVDDIISIGDQVLTENKDLLSVTLAETIISIGQGAFKECENLKEVIFNNTGNKLKTIDANAFEGCTSLNSLTIPVSVETIGDNCFKDCTNLQKITVEWDNPIDIPENVFSGITTTNITLQVPTGTAAAYRGSPMWNGFNIVEESTSGIVHKDENVIKFTINNDMLLFQEKNGQYITIYNILGKLHYAGMIQDVFLPAKGTYILNVGNQHIKILNK